MTVHILVVEDNATTSRTLALFLTAEGYQVTCAASGRDAVQLSRENSFDLLLLDLMLPDIDGLTVCKQLRTNSEVPIIMLTAKTTEEEIVEGLEAGADDYVCKPFGSKELLARIRRCLRQTKPSHEPLHRQQVGDLVIDCTQRAAWIKQTPIKLTKSEFDILRVLMERPGRVFTRDQLITLALGPDFDGFDRTIDTHIWSLRKKIGEPRGEPRYILSEPGVGYRMRHEEP